MANARFSAEVQEALDQIDEICPMATYLSESILTKDDWIDTGNMGLNAIISGSLYGGIPKGRIVQFVGESQTYKSGFMLQILANAQKKGMTVVIFDTEGAIDGDAASRMGLDVTKVKYINPITIEATRNAIFKFLTWVHQKNLKGKFLIAIDSVANLIPEMEVSRMEKDKTSADVGTFAKAVKSLLRVCNALGTATQTPIVLTNWVYDDPMAMYTSAEKNISGGKSAKYLPSVTVQLRRKLIKDEDMKTADTKLAPSQKSYSGVSICAYTTKNRFMRQYLEVELYLSHSTGMDRYYGLIEIMEGMKVISKKGAIYYDWNEEKLGYAKNFIRDVDVMENKLLPELETRIKKEWSYGSVVEEEVEVINSLEDVLEDDEDEDIVVEEVPLTALDKLKLRKKKVSDTLDRMEEEEKAEVTPEE